MLKKIIVRYFNPSADARYLCERALNLYNSNFSFLSIWIRNKLIYKYGIHLGLTAEIGKNLTLPHPLSIVIGLGCKIGNNCTIYHNVTLGTKHSLNGNSIGYPVVRDNVVIYTGTVILGSVEIGENTIIGANSLVVENLEPNSVYVGNPLKKIK